MYLKQFSEVFHLEMVQVSISETIARQIIFLPMLTSDYFDTLILETNKSWLSLHRLKRYLLKYLQNVNEVLQA